MTSLHVDFELVRMAFPIATTRRTESVVFFRFSVSTQDRFPSCAGILFVDVGGSEGMKKWLPKVFWGSPL
jgi:hypothetical protein